MSYFNLFPESVNAGSRPSVFMIFFFAMHVSLCIIIIINCNAC